MRRAEGVSHSVIRPPPWLGGDGQELGSLDQTIPSPMSTPPKTSSDGSEGSNSSNGSNNSSHGGINGGHEHDRGDHRPKGAVALQYDDATAPTNTTATSIATSPSSHKHDQYQRQQPTALTPSHSSGGVAPDTPSDQLTPNPPPLATTALLTPHSLRLREEGQGGEEGEGEDEGEGPRDGSSVDNSVVSGTTTILTVNTARSYPNAVENTDPNTNAAGRSPLGSPLERYDKRMARANATRPDSHPSSMGIAIQVRRVLEQYCRSVDLNEILSYSLPTLPGTGTSQSTGQSTGRTQSQSWPWRRERGRGGGG